MGIEPKDDKIKSVEDLRKILDEAGLPDVPIFVVPEMSEEEKRKIQLDILRDKTRKK